MRRQFFPFFFLKFMCISLFLMLFPQQGSTESPVKVAIIPFSIHAPNDLHYLQDGIRDMLASRLAWQGKVQVIDKSTTEQAAKNLKGDLTIAQAETIGKSLGANYVLFGSVTAVGQAISIDAKMAPIDQHAQPLALVTQTNMDGVIPQINQFAQQINQKVFARPGETAEASVDAESASTRNPELLVPDNMIKGDRISYLNSNFIEVNPEDSLRNPGFWRSQTFAEGIVGMDIGDVDGDGRTEIVTVSNKRVMVQKKEGNALRAIATLNATNMEQLIWVALADTDRDGKDEIYVTKLMRRNDPKGNNSDRISYGRDVIWEPASSGLQMVGGKLQVMFDNDPYMLNAVVFPRRGKLLLGQKAGNQSPSSITVTQQKTLDPTVYEMQLKGGKLATLGQANIPKRCNVFNFAVADVNNDNNDEFIYVDQDNKFSVVTASGSLLWRGRQRFAATTNGFAGQVTDLSFNQVEYFFIPSPILVTDLNNDKIPEVVVNRNPDYSTLLPSGLKYYGSGEIVSFSWDQLGMVENWKTRELGGMITSIRVGDVDGNGTPELIACMVMAKDFLKLWESKSTLFSYKLNVSQAKTAKAQ
jgi:TolB-like protein